MMLLILTTIAGGLWAFSILFNKRSLTQKLNQETHWYQIAYRPQITSFFIILLVLAVNQLTGDPVFDLSLNIEATQPHFFLLIVLEGICIGLSFIGSMNLISTINRENVSYYIAGLTGMLFLNINVFFFTKELNFMLVILAVFLLFSLLYTSIYKKTIAIHRNLFTMSFIRFLGMSVLCWTAYLAILQNTAASNPQLDRYYVYFLIESIASFTIFGYCFYRSTRNGVPFFVKYTSFRTSGFVPGILFLISNILFLNAFYDGSPLFAFLFLHGTKIVILSILFRKDTEHYDHNKRQMMFKLLIMPVILITMFLIWAANTSMPIPRNIVYTIIILADFIFIIPVQHFYYRVKYESDEQLYEYERKFYYVQQLFVLTFRDILLKNRIDLQIVHDEILRALKRSYDYYFVGLFEIWPDLKKITLKSYTSGQNNIRCASELLVMDLDTRQRLFLNALVKNKIGFQDGIIFDLPEPLANRNHLILPIHDTYLLIVVEEDIIPEKDRDYQTLAGISIEQQLGTITKRRVLNLIQNYYEMLLDLYDIKNQYDTESSQLTTLNKSIRHLFKNGLEIFSTAHLILTKKISNIEDCTNQLDAIKSRIEYLKGAIGKIGDYLDITPNRVTLDLKDVLLELVNEYDERARERNVQMTLDTPSSYRIRADKILLRRLFDNLFNNALIAMPKGGELRISLDWQDETCRVIVKDTGIGIPEKYVQRIFDPDVSMWKQEYVGVKGTGFGLSISKKIIEMHDGTILVDSILDEGTTFIINLGEK